MVKIMQFEEIVRIKEKLENVGERDRIGDNVGDNAGDNVGERGKVM